MLVGPAAPRIDNQIMRLRFRRSPIAPPSNVPTATAARKANRANWALRTQLRKAQSKFRFEHRIQRKYLAMRRLSCENKALFFVKRTFPMVAHRAASPFGTRSGAAMPVTALALDYRPREVVRRHRHPVAQLIYAVRGVMVVKTTSGQWIVPSTRALWMPAAMSHSIRMVGHVRMRTIYVKPAAAPGLPSACSVVGVSPLLNALILEAVGVRLPYRSDSRDGRLMALLIDEILALPSLELSLPFPSDPRLRVIHAEIIRVPDDLSTAAQWAHRLRLDPRTLHRLFVKDTGLTFGQWRRQARLLTALEMLARGERIVDIALAVGYRSPTAFSTMFQRQLGAPPTVYFKAVGNGSISS